MMLKKTLLIMVAAAGFTLGSGPVFSDQAIFESTSKQVSLIELFSSEGCSSCPPADQWVSTLLQNPGLWHEFIPAVFHVDYWDQLGWKDKMASSAYTERQSRYVHSWGQRTLYTPGMILNGKEWESWHRARFIPISGDTPGVLRLEVMGQDRYRVTFQTSQRQGQSWEVHLVLLGLGIESQVTRGENSGRLLRHDFTVLSFQPGALPDGGLPIEMTLKRPDTLIKLLAPKSLAIAAWVTREGDTAPVQAVGGPLNSR